MLTQKHLKYISQIWGGSASCRASALPGSPDKNDARIDRRTWLSQRVESKKQTDLK